MAHRHPTPLRNGAGQAPYDRVTANRSCPMSRWLSRHLVLALLTSGAGLSAAVSPLSGQEETAEPRRTLSSLHDSARVRVFAPGVYVDDGVFLGFVNDSVRVADADATLRVGVGEIEGLSVRGSKWRSVALQSAAVGLVAGGLAGFFLGTKGCGNVLEGCDRHAMGVSVRWGMALGGLGALLGGVAGSRIDAWRSVFP